MADIKTRIMEVIGRGPFMASLATVTGDGKPWTRYMMGIANDDMEIRFSTFASARKVEQIRNDPEVHITCGVDDPEDWETYLQIQGRAEVTGDSSEKAAFWNESIAEIFEGPDDPNYAVVIVRPYRIEVNTIGSMTPEVWES